MPYRSDTGRSRSRAGSAFAGFLVLTTAASSVWAAGAIEEVVVTAQRTEQSLQEVPIAVTAFTGAMLEEKQIINPSDLQLATPNVSFTATNFGGSSFSIRGIGNLVVGASEGGVSFHTNEIPLSTNLVAAEFFDMERVEVLRGPQGTLYGRQATGGAINFVTAKPDLDAMSGHVDVEYGDYDHQRIKGALNLPVTETFGMRFAGMALERDGYIENTAHNQVGDCLIAGTTFEQYNADPEGTTTPCTLTGIDDDVDGRDLYSFRATSALGAHRAAVRVGHVFEVPRERRPCADHQPGLQDQ
jgi:outer membrane receptor protein involved in Fe transport